MPAVASQPTMRRPPRGLEPRIARQLVSACPGVAVSVGEPRRAARGGGACGKVVPLPAPRPLVGCSPHQAAAGRDRRGG
eukprot:15477816-Alexandrium_andersonii.AAC.1